MSSPPPAMLLRVFEGSDCMQRFVSSAPSATDHIVWGTHLYNLRVRWKPLTLLDVLTQIAKRKQERE